MQSARMNDEVNSEPTTDGWRAVGDGPFAGWLIWPGDAFETLTGPFHFRCDDGIARGAFMPDGRHVNGHGIVHGGALVTFADAMAASLVHLTLDGQWAVTVTLNTEFMGAGVSGAPIEATGRVVRATKSMVFVQGHIEQSGQPILAFSSVMKKVTPP